MRALRKARGSQLLASASVMPSTAPPYRKSGHVGSLSGHAARITALRTLSPSSRAADPPRGHLPVPLVPLGEHGIEGPVPHPPGGPRAGPAQPPVKFNHQGEGLTPQGVRDRAPGPVPGPGPLCPPRRLPLRPLCLRRRRRAPPPRRRGSGHPRRLRPRRGGGRLVLGSGGLGGDEVTGVGVDFVEVGVVVVVVVGVVRWHLLDAGGDAPHRLHVRLRERLAPRPPPFASPSPLGSCAPPCMSPWAHGALALALGSPSRPLRLCPPVRAVGPAPRHLRPGLHCRRPYPSLAVPKLADRAPFHPMSSMAARLGALLAPLRVLPVPCPFPAPCPASCRPLPALCPAPLPLASVPCPRLCPRSLPCAPWPLVCPWALPLSPPVARSALPWPAPCPACALSPPSRITRRASCCRRSCGSVTPGGERLGAGRPTCRVRPVRKAALGGNGLGGLVWVWLGLVWARYFAPSLPLAAAAAAPGEAPEARAGSAPRARGVPGAAAWPAKVVARLAGAAV